MNPRKENLPLQEQNTRTTYYKTEGGQEIARQGSHLDKSAKAFYGQRLEPL